MQSTNPSTLRNRANDTLRYATYDPKKLALLHTAVALGCSLLVTVVNVLITRQIADTGGLSGMGLRSVLSTVQSVLEFVVMVALPFWEIGLIFAALGWARKEPTGPQTLLQGFLRFRSVLLLNLLRMAVLFAASFTIFYIISTVYMMTPFSDPLWELVEPMMYGSMTTQELEAMLTPEMIDSIMQASVPMLVLFGLAYVPAAVFLFYRLRFAEYAMADGINPFKALWRSVRLTAKGRCVRLLKVDLHFWWYYLALAAFAVLGFADVILAWLGVDLPISADAATILVYLVAILCQVAFCWQYQATVSTTYALLYEDFGEALSAKTVQIPPDEACRNT